MATQHFTDTSPFQGWREFTTPRERVRVELQGRSAVFYRYQNGGYVRVGEGRVPHKASCERLYSVMLELDYDNERADEVTDY